VSGAGKTTFLRRVAGDGAEWLYSDDIYALIGARPGLQAFLTPLVHLVHHARIHWRCAGVAAPCSFTRPARAELRDAPSPGAPVGAMVRLRPLLADPAGNAERDGFASVIVLSRKQANRLTALRFAA
jgi:hypothetical protein